MHSQDNHCIYASVEVKPKMTKFKLQKKGKINLRITAKADAHLQTLTKTPVKFQKILVKLYEEMHSQDTQCLYALVEVKLKNDWVQTVKKVTKLI